MLTELVGKHYRGKHEQLNHGRRYGVALESDTELEELKAQLRREFGLDSDAEVGNAIPVLQYQEQRRRQDELADLSEEVRELEQSAMADDPANRVPGTPEAKRKQVLAEWQEHLDQHEMWKREYPDSAAFSPDWSREYTPVKDAPGQGLKPWKRDQNGMHRFADEVPVEFLLDKHGNPPRYTEQAMEEFTQKIAEKGIDEEIMIFIGTDDIVYVGEGNHRLEAARRLGWTHIPARLVVQQSTVGLGGVNRNMPNLLEPTTRIIREGYAASTAPPHAMLDIPGIVRRDDITFDRYWNPEFKNVTKAMVGRYLTDEY